MNDPKAVILCSFCGEVIPVPGDSHTLSPADRQEHDLGHPVVHTHCYDAIKSRDGEPAPDETRVITCGLCSAWAVDDQPDGKLPIGWGWLLWDFEDAPLYGCPQHKTKPELRPLADGLLTDGVQMSSLSDAEGYHG